ncbi:MAG: antiterminator LoaP [Lachnospiraceae bacterium]|nr:antiterminator LoaP [Lachnospiraceae bacterium]
MWYVVQVRSGTEREIIKQCQAVISEEVLQDSFLPCYEEMKRYQGDWHTKQRLLFPGYVFLVSPELDRLYQGLKRVIGLTKLVRTGDQVIPLTEEEQSFLLRFGGEEQVVKMSTGVIENDRVVILEGPMKGLEGYIRKIDRHKRKAYLDLTLFGREQRVQVGVEIVGRKEE